MHDKAVNNHTDNHKAIIETTQRWVEKLVVGLNLCPFAKRELIKDRVRFVLSQATTEEQLLNDLHQELVWLEQHDAIETTLLIHPWVLSDFSDYNQFLDTADDLLEQFDFTGVYQIASFHPHYQFDGTQPTDVENYTNKSPYPILHILREATLEQRIADYPDSDDIPANNIALLEQLGEDKVRALLISCFSPAQSQPE
ncbi:MAG: DUF1415 domain-containing protein [Wenzhouxiangellaceae bacterium]